jgi:ribosome-associated heat shock protein Hsp15
MPYTQYAQADVFMGGEEGRVRIDKWLWAARFFKTRALAQAAVVAGKVRLHDERIKPAKEVKAGDTLAIRVGEFEWNIVIRALAERRGPADEARKLYDENANSIAQRMAQIADRKAMGGLTGERKGRPTKRERRQIIRFREGG